ncbi:MAG: diacylglycerol/lipid kinase family protein [Thermomicrobiales bacterium]
MDPRTIAVVLNPDAGGGRTLRVLPKINAELQKLGRPYHIHVTKAPGDAIPIAKRFSEEGASVILAVGGDGTINEVVNGILQSERQTPLGLVPVGHGSDFARTAGSPKDVGECVRRAANGRGRAVDVGYVQFNDGARRGFINVAGLGFDTIVAEKAQRSRLPGSKLPYLATALPSLIRFQNFTVTIDADGELFSTPAVFVQIANARFMGGGMQIAPMADIADGLLDVAIVGDFNKRELLRALPSVYSGSHVGLAKFFHVKARRVRVETMEPARVQLDGELIGQAPADFTVAPGAILLAG